MGGFDFLYVLFAVRNFMVHLPLDIINTIIQIIIKIRPKAKLFSSEQNLFIITGNKTYTCNNDKEQFIKLTKFDLDNIKYIGYCDNHWIAMLLNGNIYRGEHGKMNGTPLNFCIGYASHHAHRRDNVKIDKILFHRDVLILQTIREIHLIKHVTSSNEKRLIIPISFSIKKIRTTLNNIYVMDQNSNIHVGYDIMSNFFCNDIGYHEVNYEFAVHASNAIDFDCSDWHIVHATNYNIIMLYGVSSYKLKKIKLYGVISVTCGHYCAMLLTVYDELYEMYSDNNVLNKININNIYKFKYTYNREYSETTIIVSNPEAIHIWKYQSDAYGGAYGKSYGIMDSCDNKKVIPYGKII